MARKRVPAKRRHVRGCPRRDCTCPWTGRVRLPDGSQPRVTRDSYAEFEQAYYELMARRPEPLADRSTTIAQWAQRWQAGADWRPATRESAELTVRLHINPYIGHILMTELQHDDVRQWVKRMKDAGTGQATMGKAAEALRTMYNVWQQGGRVLPLGVPVPRGVVKRPPRKQFTRLTAAQVRAWAAAMPADMALMVEIQAYSGSRISEILGLQEKDIIWTGKDVSAPLAEQLTRLAGLPPGEYAERRPQLRFDRQLARVTRAPARTKNDGAVRTLPLAQWLAAAIAAHCAQWPPVRGWLLVNRRAPGAGQVLTTDAERAESRREITRRYQMRQRGQDAPLRKAGAKPGGAGFHYVTDGKPYHAARVNIWLHRAADEAGVVLPPNQCSHALRHHCVSFLRDQGMSDQAIGAWIGDTAQTVAQTYGRPMPDSMDRIVAALSESRDAPARPLRAV